MKKTILRVPVITDDGLKTCFVRFTGSHVNIGGKVVTTKTLTEKHQKLMSDFDDLEGDAEKLAAAKSMPVATLIRKHVVNGWTSTIFQFSWSEETLQSEVEKTLSELELERAKTQKLEAELAQLKAEMTDKSQETETATEEETEEEAPTE